MRTLSVIKKTESSPDCLSVWLEGADQPLEIPWYWVRDHSRDGESFNPDTHQRKVDSFQLDLDCPAGDAQIVNNEVIVRWGGSYGESVLSAKLLGSLLNSPDPTELWNNGTEVEPVKISFEALEGSSDEASRWLDSINRLGFALVEGVPPTLAGAEKVANRIGYVRRTVFGDMWTLSSELAAHADSAYDTTFLEPHTDGAYCHDGPGLQMFSCAERTGTGGESILLDGVAAAESLRLADPSAFDVLASVSVPSHYVEDGTDLRATRPTISLHADGRVRQVTFNNYDRSPFLLPPGEMRAWYEAYREFHELLVDRSRWWVQRLEPGDCLLFDNWRCLHGRMSFTGKRVFHGCYLNHEDFESRLRVSGPAGEA